MTVPRSSSQPPVPEVSVQSQIDALWQRGMAIPHRGEASRFLTHVGSYRLRGYWQPFEDRSQDGDPPPFRSGTNFAAVMERYHFDRELRVLLLDAFGHIEVSIRNVWALHLSETEGGGPDAHLNRRLFLDRYYVNLSELHRAYDRHGKRAHRYDFAECPIWAIAEAMSVGQLSRWYGDTNRVTRQLMVRRYGMESGYCRRCFAIWCPSEISVPITNAYGIRNSSPGCRCPIDSADSHTHGGFSIRRT